MKGLPLALLTLLIALACGSKPELSQNTTHSKSDYRGKTSNTQIDKSNQMELLHLLLGYFNSELEVPHADLNDFESLGLRSFYKKTHMMIQKISVEALQNQSFFSPSLTGLFGGKVDYQILESEQHKNIVLSFDQFSLDGKNIWNGIVTISELELHPTDQSVTAIKILMQDLEFISSSHTYNMNGQIHHQFDPSTGQFEDQWDIHLKSSKLEILLDNYFESGFKTNLGYCKSSFSGEFSHHQLGKVQFQSVDEIEFQGKTPSSGGPILVSGENKSKIKVTPEGFGLIHFELDSDGDGDYEGIISHTHSSVDVY